MTPTKAPEDALVELRARLRRIAIGGPEAADAITTLLAEQDEQTETIKLQAVRLMELSVEVTTLLERERVLRVAAERGLEWAIDAANERKQKDSVFDNAMKDIRFIEAALNPEGVLPE